MSVCRVFDLRNFKIDFGVWIIQSSLLNSKLADLDFNVRAVVPHKTFHSKGASGIKIYWLGSFKEINNASRIPKTELRDRESIYFDAL